MRLGPAEAWMVGDDLEFDIRGAQQTSIYAVWIDARGDGLQTGRSSAPLGSSGPGIHPFRHYANVREAAVP